MALYLCSSLGSSALGFCLERRSLTSATLGRVYHVAGRAPQVVSESCSLYDYVEGKRRRTWTGVSIARGHAPCADNGGERPPADAGPPLMVSDGRRVVWLALDAVGNCFPGNWRSHERAFDCRTAFYLFLSASASLVFSLVLFLPSPS